LISFSLLVFVDFSIQQAPLPVNSQSIPNAPISSGGLTPTATLNPMLLTQYPTNTGIPNTFVPNSAINPAFTTSGLTSSAIPYNYLTSNNLGYNTNALPVTTVPTLLSSVMSSLFPNTNAYSAYGYPAASTNQLLSAYYPQTSLPLNGMTTSGLPISASNLGSIGGYNPSLLSAINPNVVNPFGLTSALSSLTSPGPSAMGPTMMTNPLSSGIGGISGIGGLGGLGGIGGIGAPGSPMGPGPL